MLRERQDAKRRNYNAKEHLRMQWNDKDREGRMRMKEQGKVVES